jgi:Ni,Fe-hydrogenase I large subunit
VLARLGARLVELARLLVERDPARLPPALHAGSLSVARGEGLAWVPTSRGLLLHRARVDAGRIAAYRIVAPTEWNFHPRGALQRGLEGLRATSAAAIESAATTCVQSLDPCVRAVVEVHRA